MSCCQGTVGQNKAVQIGKIWIPKKTTTAHSWWKIHPIYLFMHVYLTYLHTWIRYDQLGSCNCSGWAFKRRGNPPFLQPALTNTLSGDLIYNNQRKIIIILKKKSRKEWSRNKMYNCRNIVKTSLCLDEGCHSRTETKGVEEGVHSPKPQATPNPAYQVTYH